MSDSGEVASRRGRRRSPEAVTDPAARPGRGSHPLVAGPGRGRPRQPARMAQGLHDVHLVQDVISEPMSAAILDWESATVFDRRFHPVPPSGNRLTEAEALADRAWGMR